MSNSAQFQSLYNRICTIAGNSGGMFPETYHEILLRIEHEFGVSHLDVQFPLRYTNLERIAIHVFQATEDRNR